MRKLNCIALAGLGCLIAGVFLSSCSSSGTGSAGLLTADIRGEIDNLTSLRLDEEVERVSYVPLEVTSDDAWLIDGVSDYAVTGKYIYVLPVKEPRIALFDRKGHFIRTLVREGQGPSEFSGLPVCIQADEENDRLYLFGMDRIWVYDLEGAFIRQIVHAYQVLFEASVGKGHFAAVAFPFRSFKEGCFGLGVFTENGDTVCMKNDFSSPLVPYDRCGLTVSMVGSYSGPQNSVLFKMGANDTVFRISEDKIAPACILALRNSDKEVAGALDISNYDELRRDPSEDGDLRVSDVFETPARYYFRFLFNPYVASVDKRTGEVLVERCERPRTTKEMADANLQHGMLGTRSLGGFPVWGRVYGGDLVQVVTPYELSLYKDINSISIPKQLDRKEDEGNPILVFYQLKEDVF